MILEILANIASHHTPVRVGTSSWDVLAVSLDTLAVLLVGLLLASAAILGVRTVELVSNTLESSLVAPGTSLATMLIFLGNQVT